MGDRQILYEYWKSIPAIKIIDAPKKVLKSHPARSAIIRVLLEGLKDDSNDPKSRIRHAFNVNELKKVLEERKEITITTTNLYFHLNILKEAGFIIEAATLLEGPKKRNKTKYFGRAARFLFATDQVESLSKFESKFREFERFAHLLGISVPTNFLTLPKKYLEIYTLHTKRIANWFASYETTILEENIDFSEVFEFLKFINRIDPEFVKMFKEVSEKVQDELSQV
ncbi:MAG: hypothetical protein ACXAC8_17025 [Candidatus Hodarchaeales archaeon]